MFATFELCNTLLLRRKFDGEAFGEGIKKPGDLSIVRRIGGGYLLFHFRSIIGVARFNFSVRNGKRWSPCAMATLVSFLHPAVIVFDADFRRMPSG